MRAEQAALKLILDYQFENVLDIGSGDGRATKLFKMCGKDAISIDLNPKSQADFILDWNKHSETFKYDCVWCSHVLEHQLNVNNFLVKIREVCTKVACITVPPAKYAIVGGHYTIWNMGLLIYNLVMAGFNCNQLIGIKQGYNISVIIPIIDPIPLDTLQLSYDKGDIELLSPYFPETLNEDVGGVYQGFNGNIIELDWYEPGIKYEELDWCKL